MITATFDVPGMSAEQYEEIMRRLDAAGLAAPDGRRLHVASAKPGGWLVVDVWDSPEQLEAFAAHLMPIVTSVVGAPPQPEVTPTHSVVAA